MQRHQLSGVSLCVLVAGGHDADDFERLVTSLFAAGVRMLQIRDKGLSDDVLFERTRAALAIGQRIASPVRPLVIVNDRVHVAADAGADGVHVGESDMPVIEARRIVGAEPIIGRTAHSLEEARAAVAAGADYLGVGPCFPSLTKAFMTHAPQEFLAQAAQLPLPVYFIGGITLERIDELRLLGVNRIAVSAAVTLAPDPSVAARQFLRAIADNA